MKAHPYLLELRIGHAKPKLNAVIRDVKNRFKLTFESPEVAHMSLYGPFAIKTGYSFHDVKTIISRNARNISALSYWVDGYDHKLNPNGGVVVFRIVPSDSFRNFLCNTSRNLQKVTISKSDWDRNPENHWYHVTIGYHLSKQRYQQILQYMNIEKAKPPGVFSYLLSILSKSNRTDQKPYPSYFFPVDALRVTVLRNRLIGAEYDLLSKRWYSRMEAKSGPNFGKTLQNYRIDKGYEIPKSQHHPEPQTYVIGDLHLGHANIIKYCARPFPWKKAEEMDRVLIKNWNNIVKKTDTVYFLGDLCGPQSKIHADWYFRHLNGNIIWVKGNHDEQKYVSSTRLVENVKKEYNGMKFFFTHDPKSTIENFTGWVLHGHEHNNNLRSYPFFNPRQMRINVSAEVIGYKPIPLSNLLQMIPTEKEARLTL